MNIAFAKLSANGNDFVAIDNRNNTFKGSEYNWITQLCDRRGGVGADGLLLVEESDKLDFHMRIFNPDGSEARMCGNGARACALFALSKGICTTEARFSTRAGNQRVTINGRTSTLYLPPPTLHPEYMQLLTENAAFVAGIQPASLRGFLHVGVPHCVLSTDHTEKADLDQIGSFVRHWQAFEPEGTNVILMSRVDASTLRIRAWEKGVDAETHGCGTGCVAACVLLAQQGLVQTPVECIMPGGTLTVDHHDNTWSFSGRARLVFEGVMNLE